MLNKLTSNQADTMRGYAAFLQDTDRQNANFTIERYLVLTRYSYALKKRGLSPMDPALLDKVMSKEFGDVIAEALFPAVSTRILDAMRSKIQDALDKSEAIKEPRYFTEMTVSDLDAAIEAFRAMRAALVREEFTGIAAHSSTMYNAGLHELERLGIERI